MKRLFISILVLVAALLLSVPALAQDGDAPVVVADVDELIIAIDEASEGDIIYISQHIYMQDGQTIGDADKQVTIMRVDGYSGAVLSTSANTIIQNIVFDGGNVGDSEAAFSFSFSVLVNNCNYQNFADSGIIRSGFGSTVLMEKCAFENNVIQNSMIHALPDSEVEIIGTAFINNSSARIIFNTTVMSISGCTFDNNATTGIGGGNVYNNPNGVMILENCVLTNNTAMRGGAVENSGTLTIKDCLIYDNTADYIGNDIYNDADGILTIQNSLEEYSEFFADFELVPLGWYYDTADTRYSKDNAVLFSIPVSNYDERVGLVFVFQSDDDDHTNNDPPAQPDNGENPPANNNGNSNNSNPNNGNGSNSDYSPPYIPSTPSTSNDTPDVKETTEPDDVPTETFNPLRCGNAVLDLTSTAFLLGYGDGDLHRADLLTRAQMMQIVYRLLTPESLEAVHSIANDFTDCDPDAWFNEAVSTIANSGVVVGIGNGRFDPDGNLTWAQIVTIFTRFTVLQPDTELNNIDIGSHWSAGYVKTAVARGWIDDTADFDVNALISRGEMVDFINRIFELERNIGGDTSTTR